MKKVQFIIISSILSFGLIVSGALISNALDKVIRNDNRITVKGVSEKTINADESVINIILYSKNNDMEELKKDILEKEILVKEFINMLRLNENEYQVKNLRIKPNFIGETNKISNYEGFETITIMPKEISKTNDIYESLQELKLKSKDIEIIKPEYFITSIEKYKKELLVEAMKNAENRAFELLKLRNNKIKEVKNITQGQFELLETKENINFINEEVKNQENKKIKVAVTVTYTFDKIN